MSIIENIMKMKKRIKRQFKILEEHAYKIQSFFDLVDKDQNLCLKIILKNVKYNII